MNTGRPNAGYEVVLSSATNRERILLAGFPVAEIPIIRRTLDESGGYHIDMIVCDPQTLSRPLKQVFEDTPPIEWLKPIPLAWIDGQGWGQTRVILFGRDISHVHQLDIVQVLHDIGISRLYSGSVEFFLDEEVSVAEALAQAVQSSPADKDPYSKTDFVDDSEGEDENDFMKETENLETVEYRVIDEIFSSCQEHE